MPILSTTAWVFHDLGLATAFGGGLTGRVAFQHAIERHVQHPAERALTLDHAWRRFQVMNLIGHGAVALSWFVGRRMLTGREVSGTARTLTVLKDVFVGASLASGIANAIIGRKLAREARAEAEVGGELAAGVEMPEPRLERGARKLGALNLIANAGALAVTALLGMQASKSRRFARVSRRLP